MTGTGRKRRAVGQVGAGVSGLFASIGLERTEPSYTYTLETTAFPAVQPTNQRKDGKADKLSEFVWILYNHYRRRMYHSDELGPELEVSPGKEGGTLELLLISPPGSVVQLSNNSKSGL